MSRDFQLPGRSTVIACEGMAASSHPLASLAAIETLRAGGNAADAAITATAVLGVVEPHMTGIGGDCFCMIDVPGRPVWGYNGCGRSGAGASAGALIAQGLRAIAPTSIHAVTVPGAVDAWAAILATHGRFELARALAPAIRYAEEGFPVAPRVAFDWSAAAGKLASDAGATRHFLPGGRTPAVGDVVRLPALAQTLRTLADHGPRAFYEGGIAQEIVATLAARGSFLRAGDFAAHRGEAVAPIATSYRGLDVLELPPNTQGLTALVLLNILERFDLGALDPDGPDRLHLMLEAGRLAYGVRDAHIADPAAMRIGASALLDKTFADGLARSIDPARRVALPSAPTPPGDTIYLTVVDRDRLAVSLVNTLYSSFGVGICTERSGIMLTNRGACFVLDPAHPNTFGPAKRPMHTIIPALASRGGRCELAFGVMGAHYQPMGHAQLITGLVDHGLDVQAAIDAPRVFFVADDTVVERGVPAATVQALTARGHHVVAAPSPWGGAQAIMIDHARGVLIAGSDPRKDGCALGY